MKKIVYLLLVSALLLSLFTSCSNSEEATITSSDIISSSNSDIISSADSDINIDTSNIPQFDTSVPHVFSHFGFENLVLGYMPYLLDETLDFPVYHNNIGSYILFKRTEETIIEDEVEYIKIITEDNVSRFIKASLFISIQNENNKDENGYEKLYFNGILTNDIYLNTIVFSITGAEEYWDEHDYSTINYLHNLSNPIFNSEESVLNFLLTKEEYKDYILVTAPFGKLSIYNPDTGHYIFSSGARNFNINLITNKSEASFYVNSLIDDNKYTLEYLTSQGISDITLPCAMFTSYYEGEEITAINSDKSDFAVLMLKEKILPFYTSEHTFYYLNSIEENFYSNTSLNATIIPPYKNDELIVSSQLPIHFLSYDNDKLPDYFKNLPLTYIQRETPEIVTNMYPRIDDFVSDAVFVDNTLDYPVYHDDYGSYIVVKITGNEVVKDGTTYFEIITEDNVLRYININISNFPYDDDNFTQIYQPLYFSGSLTNDLYLNQILFTVSPFQFHKHYHGFADGRELWNVDRQIMRFYDNFEFYSEEEIYNFLLTLEEYENYTLITSTFGKLSLYNSDTKHYIYIPGAIYSNESTEDLRNYGIGNFGMPLALLSDFYENDDFSYYDSTRGSTAVSLITKKLIPLNAVYSVY